MTDNFKFTKPKGGHSGKNGEMSLTQRKRLDILNAAIQEFQARGYRATSMDAIAARANVSKRTVYNHYKGKADLFQAAVLDLWDRLVRTNVYEYRPEASLREQLTAIAYNEINFHSDADNFALARVVVSECVSNPDLGRSIFESVVQSDVGIFDWLKKAVADGRLNVKNPELAAYQFLGMIESLAFWPQLVGGQPPLDQAGRDQVVDSVVSLFLDDYQKQ